MAAPEQDREVSRSSLEEPLVLRTEQDLVELNKKDVAEYTQRMEAIPQKLEEDFSHFQESDNGLATDVDMDTYVDAFLLKYPEYKSEDRATLTAELELLRANPVVTAVRSFFSLRDYKLALALFNHSLVSNPVDLNYTLINNTGGLYSHIKELLRVEGFTNKMISFSRAGTNKTSLTTDEEFRVGDLYWSIHGYDWKRTRTAYNKAYFKIIDTYDFNKWKDIPGIVAGYAGTHPYSLEIYGLVQNGQMK